MLPYTLRQLEYLVACVDHASIARAAEALAVSQPTISVAIAKLEDHFGVQLLVRHHSQGVSATPSSQTVLRLARRLLADAQELQRAAQLANTRVSGTLRIGSFSTLAPVVLPSLLKELRQAYPDIKVTIKEGTQEDLLKALSEGMVDLILLYDLELPAGLRCIDLDERAPYVALPAKHPLAERSELELVDLIDEPMILLDVPPSRGYFLGLFDTAGLKPRIAHSSPSLELVRGMVGQGLGYSILVTRPKGDITHDGNKLEVRPIRGDVKLSRLVLVSQSNIRPTRLITCFEDVASALFKGKREIV